MTTFLKIKLTPDFVRRLEGAAQRSGISKNEFARIALERAIDADEAAPRPLDLLRDLIGKYDLRGVNLSHADPGDVIREKFRRERAKFTRRAR